MTKMGDWCIIEAYYEKSGGLERMKLNFTGEIAPVKAGILELAKQLDIEPSFGGEGLEVAVEKGEGLSVRCAGCPK